jgi:hypothetical protein
VPPEIVPLVETPTVPVVEVVELPEELDDVVWLPEAVTVVLD